MKIADINSNTEIETPQDDKFSRKGRQAMIDLGLGMGILLAFSVNMKGCFETEAPQPALFKKAKIAVVTDTPKP